MLYFYMGPIDGAIPSQFISLEAELTLVPSFVAILKDNERLSCEYRTTLYSEGDWTIVRCFNR
jgi:hypothetical protein